MTKHDGIKLQHGSLVLIADGRKAIIARNDGAPNAPRLKVCATLVAEDNPATREQGTDRPGRFAKGAERRGAAEGTDWHALAEEAFLRTAAHQFAEALHEGAECAPVVIAPPPALALLRKHLPKTVGATMSSLAKDLTKHTMAEIEAALAAA